MQTLPEQKEASLAKEKEEAPPYPQLDAFRLKVKAWQYWQNVDTRQVWQVVDMPNIWWMKVLLLRVEQRPAPYHTTIRTVEDMLSAINSGKLQPWYPVIV